MRKRLYRELDWLSGACDLDALSDEQLCTLAKWARAQLSTHDRVRCPAIGKVEKERRLGATNRFGWRWVVYVAPVDLTTQKSELEWSERGVFRQRNEAFQKKRAFVAVEAAIRADRQLHGDVQTQEAM